jgi:hypothetical protein
MDDVGKRSISCSCLYKFNSRCRAMHIFHLNIFNLLCILTALAWLADYESPSRLKPGQSRGFQAKPGRNITSCQLEREEPEVLMSHSVTNRRLIYSMLLAIPPSTVLLVALSKNALESDCLLTTMPSLPKHSFGWHYIYLRLFVGLIRSIAMPAQWLRIRKYKIHEGVVVKKIAVPSRDKGRNIKVHLYQPAGYDSTKPTPALINFHGSVISPGLLLLKFMCLLQLRIHYSISWHESRILLSHCHSHTMCSP